MKRYTISFDILAPDSIQADEVLSSVQGEVGEFQIGHTRLLPLNLRISRDFGSVRSSESAPMRDRNQALNTEIMALVKTIRDEAGDDAATPALSAETTRKVNELAKLVIKKIDKQ